MGVQHELELVKAGLLYADTVEVLSLGNQMLREITEFATGGGNQMWSLLRALDDDTLRQMTPGADLDDVRQAISLFSSADARSLRSTPGFEGLADLVDQANEQASSRMEDIRSEFQQLKIDSGADELERAVKRKLVRINRNVDVSDDGDTVIDAFVAELKRYLLDPTKFVLLDTSVSSLARAMIREGHIQLPARVVSNSLDATLGTGLISRLPTFTEAPFDEVVDLRQDLEEPLGRYRRKVSQLRGHMQTEPFDVHIQAEVDALWRSEVDPAIAVIRQAMADHSLVRELLKSAGTNVMDFVKGVAAPAVLTVFSANMLDLGTAVAAGLTGAAASGPTITGALIKRQEGQSIARSHDLYYLYEVDRRLGT